MHSKSCSKTIGVCESSSVDVLQAGEKGQTSDSSLENVLIQEHREEKQEDSRMAKDCVRCINIPTEEVTDHLAATSCHEAERRDTSKEEAKKDFHMVDMSVVGESCDNEERICRICHFGNDQSEDDYDDDDDRVFGNLSHDLIEIGCNCKNGLGLAHVHCAITWFKIRGNSVCEICGSIAMNVRVRLMGEELLLMTERLFRKQRIVTLEETRRHGRVQYFFIYLGFLLIVLLIYTLTNG